LARRLAIMDIEDIQSACNLIRLDMIDSKFSLSESFCKFPILSVLLASSPSDGCVADGPPGD
jgi:hypothetical protein